MDTTLRNILIVVIAVILIGGGFLLYRDMNASPASSTATSTTPAGTEQTISDGTITIPYIAEEFGLAVSPQQILVTSYIPPCDSDFDYCFYYNGPDYRGTNFESAGLRVKKRTDLTTQTQCLKTLPDGYTDIVPVISTSTGFMRSLISPIGDAAAGHYSAGALYRLLYNGSCYEFETRIGASQYANYPQGTIQEFTTAQQAAIGEKLLRLLKAVTLPGDVKPF